MDTTVWRWFPHCLIGSMAAVFVVNGYMVYDALKTFPGEAGRDGFDLSNQYDHVLAKVQEQTALGWQIETLVTDSHYPVLRLRDRAGAPLAAAHIDAHAERPLGPPETTALVFRPAEDGSYRAETTLWSGQWDIMLTVQTDGRQYSTTRRGIVK